jgi:hypothetical protein
MNKITNVENVVCSVETLSRHADLYHYTAPEAFEGIVRSQTPWCSHYREMLDTDEVRLMRDLLPPAVAPRMDTIIEEEFNRETRRIWNASGGGDPTARDLVNSLYARPLTARQSTPRSRPICFRSRLTRTTQRLIASTVSAANGTATQGARDTASSLTLAKSRECSSRKATLDIGLG